MKTVSDYQNDIQKAQEKIRKIQESCTHNNFFTGMYSWRPGAMAPSRICSDCNLPLGNITQEEYDAVMNSTYQSIDLFPEEDGDCP
jgi:hypothetical protein